MWEHRQAKRIRIDSLELNYDDQACSSMQKVDRNKQSSAPPQLVEEGIPSMKPGKRVATKSAASSSSSAAAARFKLHSPIIPPKASISFNSKSAIGLHFDNSTDSMTMIRKSFSFDRSFPPFSPTSMLTVATAVAVSSPTPMTDAILTASMLSLAVLTPGLPPCSSFALHDASIQFPLSTQNTNTNHMASQSTASILGAEKYLRWSELEDEILTMAILETSNAQAPFQWKKIVQNYFLDGSRTEKQCRSRWLRKLDPKLKGGEWSDAEDTLILTLRWDEELTFGDIAPRLPGRRIESIRDRYQSFLDPLLRKDPWEVKEKMTLFNMVRSMGPKWKTIAPHFPGRSESSCRNTWFNNEQSKQRFKRRTDKRKELKKEMGLDKPTKKRRIIEREDVSVGVPPNESTLQHALDLELIESVQKHTNGVLAFERKYTEKVETVAASITNLKRTARIPLKKRNVAARIDTGASTPDWTEDITNVVEL